MLRIFCFAQDNVTVGRETERERERQREREIENPATVAAYGLPLQLPLRFADDLFISTMMTLLRSDDWQVERGEERRVKGCAWADAEINDFHANVFCRKQFALNMFAVVAVTYRIAIADKCNVMQI